MLIFWVFWVLLIFRIINLGLKFLVTRKRLTYHAAITDGIACRPLNYGVWNACETLCVNIKLRLPTKDVEETYVVLIVLKHLLFVHATKYGVINVSG